MPVMMVHGVPDTHVLWDAIRGELGRDDVLAPDLPGFGRDLPDAFGGTKEEYAAWLLGEVEGVGEPVHLVGHDWGGILVQRVASLRPDLVRTWTVGGGGIDPEYEWHDVARLWQQPDTEDDAVPGADAVMRRSILALYRSATDVFREWSPEVDRAPSRALLVWGADDPFVPPRHAQQIAARVGGEALVLEGCGHWWPHERPAEVAAALTRLWSGAP